MREKALQKLTRIFCFFFGHDWSDYQYPEEYYKHRLTEYTMHRTCIDCGKQETIIRKEEL